MLLSLCLFDKLKLIIMGKFEYKIISIHENGCSTILFGSAKLPLEKITKVMNDNAKDGWRVNFQIIELKRLFLFWSRESMIVTFERPIND